MDSIINEDQSLEISETNLLQSDNVSELLQKDFYEKFKLGQNIYDPSMTISRLSIIDKTSDDHTNNTYIKMTNTSERLAEVLYQNQLMENKIKMLEQQLQSAFQHIEILQKENENKQNEINQFNEKIGIQTKNYENIQNLNQQLTKKVSNLQEVIKNQSKQLQITKPINLPTSDRKYLNSKSNQSICMSKNKEQTEESTVRDSSTSELNNPMFYSGQHFYKSSKQFWSPPQQNSPLTEKTSLEKRIESTLAQIRAIKQQFQQFNHHK